MTDLQTRKPHILVVEDEDSIAVALEFIVTREGYDHDRVASGAGALERIRTTHPDLVLLDVMLPEVTGYEICQAVRLDPTLADVKILMMTAQGSAIGQKKGLALGADGFIAKPFELRTLREEVRRLLSTPRAGGAGQPA
jgi:DNA-binding response OmpR family regulator